MPSTHPSQQPDSTPPDDELDDALGHSLGQDLAELATRAAQLHRLIGRARDAAPATAQGRDASGVAHVEIDHSGLPTVLRLTSPWSPRLAPARLGPALLEAYQCAVGGHLARWGEDLQRDGWPDDARDLDDGRSPTPDGAETATPFRAPVASGTPRPLSRLVDDTLRELDWAHDLARAPQRPSPDAPTPAGRVAIVLRDGGLVDVHLDARWAAGRTAATINRELAAALQRAVLASAPPTPTNPRAAEHDQVLGEVIELLHQHTEGR